jgi:hypothetical protein
MRKSAIVIMFLVIFLSMLPLAQTGSVQVNLPIYPSMYIATPKPYQETIYQNSSSLIQVYAYTDKLSELQCVDIFYSLDDNPNKTLSLSKMESIQERTVDNYAYGTSYNLTFGFHTINAYSTYTNGETLLDSVKFFVNVTSSNPLLLLSPINATYNSTEVPITCIIDDQLALEYSLDGASYIPSASNSTLTGLSEGPHNLTVRVLSAYGTYSQQTINLTIKTENDNQIATLAISATLLAIGIVLAAILIWKKFTSKQSYLKLT